METYDKAADALPAEFYQGKVDCGLILGSGWGNTLRHEKQIASVPYSSIPGLGGTTIPGHNGELRLYERHGRKICAFLGRRHYYEGLGLEPVVMPVELLRRMGCRQVLVTNASGGINPAFKRGELMIIADHINTVGVNALLGPVKKDWGPRFPDMSEVYSKRLRNLLRLSAQAAKVPIQEGVYCFTSGPVFETPAEIRAYRMLGADAVGMSTVPEATLAASIGMEVAGLSCISNMASGIENGPLNHKEVMEQTAASTPKMADVVDRFIELL